MKNHLLKGSSIYTALLVFCAFASLTLISFPLYSQGRIAQRIAEINRDGVFNEEVKLFSAVPYSNSEISQTITRYTALKVNDDLNRILFSKPGYLKLTIPLENGASSLTVLL